MVLEYLIESEEQVDKAISIAKDTQICAIKKSLTDDCFILTFEIKGDSKDAALKLSDVNDFIVENNNPTVLSNGAAAYFNKMLFPLINDFERKLRKLLYAASALKSTENDTIEKLEEKDFGTIFDGLFLDKKYWDKVKGFVGGNKKTGEAWSGYSFELKQFLENTTENLLWDELLPGKVPLLRSKFGEIRLRRNDIMHAHNINKKDYNISKKLFEDVNKQIDDAIEDLADGALIPDTYNQTIEDAFFFVDDNGDYIIDSQGNRLIF